MAATADKKKVDIIDVKRYGNYDIKGKQYFEGMRNAILEIFPTAEDGKNYEKLTIAFAEKFGFVAADTLVAFREDIIAEAKQLAAQTNQAAAATSTTNKLG